MLYQNQSFLVILALVSLVFVWQNVKEIFASFAKCSDTITESQKYAEKFGRKAVTIFTIITVALSILYVVFANMIGRIPATVMYVFVIIQMCNLMLENMCLARMIKYNKPQFVFDKVQRGLNLALSTWVVVAIVCNIRPF